MFYSCGSSNHIMEHICPDCPKIIENIWAPTMKMLLSRITEKGLIERLIKLSGWHDALLLRNNYYCRSHPQAAGRSSNNSKLSKIRAQVWRNLIWWDSSRSTKRYRSLDQCPRVFVDEIIAALDGCTGRDTTTSNEALYFLQGEDGTAKTYLLNVL